MQKDITFTAVLVAWLMTLTAAYFLGVYSAYRYESNRISTQEYYRETLQQLEDIRYNTYATNEAVRDLYSDF